MCRAACIAIVICGFAAVAPAQSMSAAGEAHQAMEPTPLGIEDTRNASGTAWQPDSTPMFMWHTRAGGWQLGLHTNSFFGYDGATSRGGDDLISINWLMGMASHSVGSGDLMFRAMLSAEPATMPENGYPLLLQTGETYKGEAIHDRQHPHDLFMELAVRYRQPIADTVGVELYLAPVGEPALGPAAFPHRFTSMGDPLAPLGHHWLDSTHIVLGVATVGVFTERFKLEGSYFDGREPDEDRYGLYFRVPDSFSARLSVNPTRDLSAQVSWAHLDSPEWDLVDVSVDRTTASATWNHPLPAPASNVAVTAAVGHNNPSMGASTYASLVESTALLRDTHTVFARAEALTKSGHDLALPVEMEADTFGIGALSAGYVYDFHPPGPFVTGVGVVGTIDVVGETLGAVYDTRTPWGGMVFVRVRPPMMNHAPMTNHAAPMTNHAPSTAAPMHHSM
jgi:hypothetical protein